MPDFTLDSYKSILEAALKKELPLLPIFDWHQLSPEARSGIVLRHDVDRRPGNALAMAELEHALGVKSSYFFRILPVAYDTAIIGKIAALGHEIGYHYEDWALGKRVKDAAVAKFEENLATIREVADIKSIAMHGSPMSSESNLTIWEHINYEDYDLVDATYSIDYSNCIYVTDSGRTFGSTSLNMRDHLPNAQTLPDVETTDDLVRYIDNNEVKQMKISTHPERWNPYGASWYRQYLTDSAINLAKMGIRQLSSGKRVS